MPGRWGGGERVIGYMDTWRASYREVGGRRSADKGGHDGAGADVWCRKIVNTRIVGVNEERASENMIDIDPYPFLQQTTLPEMELEQNILNGAKDDCKEVTVDEYQFRELKSCGHAHLIC
jgi:hypothetical protein